MDREAVQGVVAVVVLIAVLLFVSGGLVGYFDGRRDERKAAVKAGAAEWVPAPDGSAEFRYRSQP